MSSDSIVINLNIVKQDSIRFFSSGKYTAHNGDYANESYQLSFFCSKTAKISIRHWRTSTYVIHWN